MVVFSSLKTPPLSKEVEKQLRASINAGIFRPGDKLPSEHELVDQFQVSRVTVREALKNLKNLGLISIKRGVNAGAYVSEPTSEPITQSIDNLIQMGKVNFGHLIEIRLYLEPAVAAVVALQHSQENIDSLSQLLDTAEAQLRNSRKKARLTNVGFHLEVARITKNPLIIFFSESITQVYSAMLIELTHTKLGEKGVKELILEHRAILDAIAERNPQEAYGRTKKHLIQTFDTYSRIIADGCSELIDERIKYFSKL
ncbi:MAG: hypothetical protein DRG83_00985 [Deltaproteobacteria bacterium]|nr:MAG: hypothetical protein DRG83_00985 [Deltaproteobacteria bacterium]